jgi:hypothetical protein
MMINNGSSNVNVVIKTMADRDPILTRAVTESLTKVVVNAVCKIIQVVAAAVVIISSSISARVMSVGQGPIPSRGVPVPRETLLVSTVMMITTTTTLLMNNASPPLQLQDVNRALLGPED